jgi:hypothetical protein
MWETTNSKLPTPILMVGQLEIGKSSQIVFITLFSGSCYGLLCPLQTSGTVQKCSPKTILLSQTGMFDFSSSNFNFQGHTLHGWSRT